MQDKIKQKCDEIRDLLLEKNKSYGNSVFDKGVLFEVEPMYAIQARINDKINRIKSKSNYLSENDLMDLTGYFILLQVLRDEMDRVSNHTEPSPTTYSYEWNMRDHEEGEHFLFFQDTKYQLHN
jgi:hypothetical protein